LTIIAIYLAVLNACHRQPIYHYPSFIHCIRVYGGFFAMRVYTNSAVRALVSYGKLFVGLAIVFVVLSQAAKLWGDDPAIQEIRNLLQLEQTEQP
jgi:hypothetical protein